MRVPAIIVGTYDSPCLKYHQDLGGDFVPNQGYGVININPLRIMSSAWGDECDDSPRIWLFNRKQLTIFLLNYLDHLESGKSLPNYFDNKKYPIMHVDNVDGDDVSMRQIILRPKVKKEGADELDTEYCQTTILEESKDMHCMCVCEDERRIVGYYEDEGILCLSFDIELDKRGEISFCEILNETVELILLKMIIEETIKEEEYENKNLSYRLERLKRKSEQYEKEIKNRH